MTPRDVLLAMPAETGRGVLVRTGPATYKRVRGPDGGRFAAWKASLRKKALERYGLDELTPLGFVNDVNRRAMRNARRRERAIARAS